MISFRDAVSDLPEAAGQPNRALDYAGKPQNEFQRRMRGSTSKVTEHIAPGHGAKMVAMMAFIPEGRSARDPAVFAKIPPHLRPGSSFRSSYARLRWDRPAPTITCSCGKPSSARCIHPSEPRALTIREAARCQSFPDSYVFLGGDGDKRMQIGNAVPPLLAEAMGRAVLSCLERQSP